MKSLTSSIILLGIVGCSSHYATISDGEPTPEGYAAAKEFIGKDAVSEFEKNRKEGKIRFYGVGEHLTGEVEVLGLTKEEGEKYIEKMGIEVEAVVEDVNPFAVVSKEFTFSDYWKVMDEFMTQYNKLVIEELEKEEPNQAAHTTPAIAPR